MGIIGRLDRERKYSVSPPHDKGNSCRHNVLLCVKHVHVCMLMSVVRCSLTEGAEGNLADSVDDRLSGH